MRKIFAVDDWGFSESVNDGILALAKRDLLESVSILANGPAIDYKLSELLSYKSHFDIYLHFNVTEGPSLAHRSATSMTRRDGQFKSKSNIFLRLAFGIFDASELVQEFEAQIAQLKRKKIPINGFNGHHHVHMFSRCMGALLQPLKLHGLHKIRLMRDREHLFTFILGIFFSRTLRRERAFVLQKTNYLVPRNLISAKAFTQKIRFGRPLLAHPATHSGQTTTDSFATRRTIELEKILEFSMGPDDVR